MKKCTKCNTLKEESSFSKQSNSKDGLYPYCRECKSINDKKYRERVFGKPKDTNIMSKDPSQPWFPIKNYEGFYCINKIGEILCLGYKLLETDKNGNSRYFTTKKRILSPMINKLGYPQVSLRNENGRKSHHVHRLMAINFIPNPENKPQVNHINSIRSDVSLENLEWVTVKENYHHALENNRSANKRIFSDEFVNNLKTQHLGGKSIYRLAKDYGLCRDNLSKILKGKSFRGRI